MAAIPDEKKVAYNYLGRCGMKVSNIAMGTMTFGPMNKGTPGWCDEDLSHQILNRYVEWGGNFLDTADVYGNGKSEEIVGTWLEKQPRDNFVVATKVWGDMGSQKNINNRGLSRKHIMASIDASLKRLRTDFVDLYQAHCWEDGTPIEETLRTFNDLVRCGKVRYLGVSNVTGEQMRKIDETCKRLGLEPIVSLQQQYSLVMRECEVGLYQVCKELGVGVLPWSPLKGGLLSGKFKRGERPTEGRLGYIAADESKGMHSHPAWSTFDDKTFDILETAEAIGKKHGKSMAQVALRWLLQKDVVPSVIIGARTLAQLDDNMGAANGWSLSKEEMQQLDTVSAIRIPYPYDRVIGFNESRQNPFLANTYVQSTSE